MIKNKYLFAVVLSGLFIALALVARQFFTVMIQIFGAPGLRIGLAGIFSTLPAILFGPLFGGIALGVLDVLGYIINPMGAYIWPLTISAVAEGVAIALMWLVVKKTDVKKLKNIYLVIVILAVMGSVLNHIFISIYPDNPWLNLLKIGEWDISVINIFGIDIIAAAGLIFYFFNLGLVKIIKNDSIHLNFLKLTAALGLPGLIFTTINTYILKLYIPVFTSKSFMLLWLPRLISQVFIVIINAYVISFIIELYKKTVGRKI